MKPMRHLAVPDCPSFVVKVETNSGKCEQFPEMRIERLLSTERFRRFLRARRSDGAWRWVKPEVGENDELTRDSILESCVALAPKSERERRQFEDDLDVARSDTSGKCAFELYVKYVQGKVVIEGELASQKFLEIAVGKQWPAAVERNNLDQAERKLRSGFIELDLSVVEKVCADVRAFIGREGRSDITPAQFVNHWFEHKEEWGRFCNVLERAAYSEGAATCNVVMFGVAEYYLLGPIEKSMFMKYLSAVAVAKTQYKGRGDYGTEVDLFVKMLRDVCG